MKSFITRLFWFLLPLLFFSFSGIFLPVTPRASKSLLFANQQKDKLLLSTASPRIIFVGGSNLSFGLNSQMVKDELNVNPINTGVHASIGLRYMLNNTIQYVRDGDIIILSLEYSHFYRDYDYVSEELLRTILDVNLSKVKLLSPQQVINLIPLIPKYTVSKFEYSEYFDVIESDIYSVNSFNQYGDVDAHWGMKKVEFQPYGTINTELNESSFLHILEFQEEVIKRGAILFITYPGFQDISFANSKEQIERVEIEFNKHGFLILGTPERYKIPDEMVFNTPYHLTKEGVDYRTRLFIEDYKKMILDQATKQARDF